MLYSMRVRQENLRDQYYSLYRGELANDIVNISMPVDYYVLMWIIMNLLYEVHTNFGKFFMVVKIGMSNLTTLSLNQLS